MQDNAIAKVTSCRICKSRDLTKVISLGSTPLANSFLKNADLDKPEPFYPLEVIFCENCKLVQLAHVVNPDLLFRNYVYVSSTSATFRQHFESYASDAERRFKLTKKSLVVDIGSNDGILLKPFKKLGMKVLGVDPATDIATKATKEGIETLPEYFDQSFANKIVKKKGKADLVSANNVFAHINDINEIALAVKILLKPQGVFVIEVPYLVDFYQNNLFDTIYHEHLSYYSVKPLISFFEKHDMRVFDVQRVSSHGGSIRVFVKRKNAKHKVQPIVKKLIEQEKKLGLHEAHTFIEFANQIKKNKTKLVRLLNKLKIKGNVIVGYGAPAKGNTLLNYFSIGKDILDYIVDDSPLKQGLFTPGTQIPVVSSKELTKKKPDYILILAWNFAEPIMNKLSDFSIRGGKFIIPAPEPSIIRPKKSVAANIVDEDISYIVEKLGTDASKLEGQTLLISGGSGFLGSYFTKTISFLNDRVLTNKCKVISIDNYITGSADKNFLGEIDDDNIEFIFHDIRLPMFITEKVDYIIHAAGLASPYYYKKYPLETIESAIVGAKNLLELARTKNAKGFLFFSSSEIYGDPDPKSVPTPETYTGNVSSIGPRACYDESKRLGETISITYHQQFKVPIAIVRPFNVYGPGMKANDYRVIPTFMYKGLNGQDLPVHGTGKQTRTFCYATDATVAFFKVLLLGKPGEIYNVGNDSPEITMLDLARKIATTLDNGVKAHTIKYPSSYPAGEPSRRCPDLTKIKSELNYNPGVDLDKGLRKTILWYRSTYNL